MSKKTQPTIKFSIILPPLTHDFLDSDSDVLSRGDQTKLPEPQHPTALCRRTGDSSSDPR